MSGMPLFQALLLLASAVILIALAQSRRLHPFLALIIVATAFGLAAGFSTAFVGKTFGVGFSQAMLGPGLVIVAAGFVAAIAESSGASDRLTAAIGRWRFPGSADDRGVARPDRRPWRFVRRRVRAADAAFAAARRWRCAPRRKGRDDDGARNFGRPRSPFAVASADRRGVDPRRILGPRRAVRRADRARGRSRRRGVGAMAAGWR